jgi:hypothetical protein
MHMMSVVALFAGAGGGVTGLGMVTDNRKSCVATPS